MLNFFSKIAAIKHIREMFTNPVPRVEVTELNTFKVAIEPISLKESKDLVEAIMVLGVRYFLEDSKGFLTTPGAREMLREVSNTKADNPW